MGKQQEEKLTGMGRAFAYAPLSCVGCRGPVVSVFFSHLCSQHLLSSYQMKTCLLSRATETDETRDWCEAEENKNNGQSSGARMNGLIHKCSQGPCDGSENGVLGKKRHIVPRGFSV